MKKETIDNVYVCLSRKKKRNNISYSFVFQFSTSLIRSAIDRTHMVNKKKIFYHFLSDLIISLDDKTDKTN